jgi:hypothetical protein
MNPNDPSDALQDSDGDGQSNRAEYLAGTNPQQADSHFSMSVVPTAVEGQYAVRFNAVAGRTYSVLYKNNLSDTTWAKLLDVPAQAATASLRRLIPGAWVSRTAFTAWLRQPNLDPAEPGTQVKELTAQ